MPLKFSPAGTFTIAQFTDLHYRNGEAADRQTLDLMGRILNAHPPDLVVLTGDTIDGSFCHDAVRSFADAVRPITDRALPWAAVFGNHDDEGPASRSQLMESMQSLSGCLATSGPQSLAGVGNFVLTIDGPNGPAARLFFLDSHAYADTEQKTYQPIQPDQIAWYQNQPHDLPALMFFHIPLPEYETVWATGRCSGSRHETVCCPLVNTGLFAALKSGGDVIGVFTGHDHVNDYSGDLDGIRLTYGRCTGFASYGRPGFPRGARIIRLQQGSHRFETEVVFEPRVVADR